MAIKDITEDIPYDLTRASTTTSFSLTDTAYDITFDDIPFIMKVDNQNPYRRETAPYKKDQFDNSTEPGEQSLSGWWLRSQTSWHNGSGILYYEPGVDYQHVSHRFQDSRGVDVWTIGQATLLPEVFHGYTGANGINATEAVDTVNGTDCIVSGDSLGILKKIRLDGNNNVTGVSPYEVKYTVSAGTNLSGHSGTNHPIYSVACDGDNYWAACDGAIHKGSVSTTNTDTIFASHNSSSGKVMMKYAKGYMFFGADAVLNMLDTSYSSGSGHGGAALTGTAKLDSKTHINSSFQWVDMTGGSSFIYAAGHSGGSSEVWQIGFDTTVTGGNLLPDVAGATMVLELPFGEIINCIQYYLGHLILGTSKGIRICTFSVYDRVSLGPLLAKTSYGVNHLSVKDSYVYGATKVLAENGVNTHASLIRVDMSRKFDDGTFAYANDLEYRSSIVESWSVRNKALTSNVATLTFTDAHDLKVGESAVVSNVDATFNGTYTITAVGTNTISYAKVATNVTSTAVSPYGTVNNVATSSNATEVYNVDGRMIIVVEEDGSGELQVEHTTNKRDTGWMTTGKIRYGTVEPKYFRYINLQCTTGTGDTITVSTIDSDGVEVPLAEVSAGISNQDIFISTPDTSQENMGFKFTLNNASSDSNLPVIQSYQVKAVPASRRQRLFQYPLQCYNFEMDRFNSQFGYDGRASEMISRLESMEETGRFITVNDYRTDESFTGIIEEVKFTNESSPDKNNSGFGGLLLVTVRKM